LLNAAVPALDIGSVDTGKEAAVSARRIFPVATVFDPDDAFTCALISVIKPYGIVWPLHEMPTP
jgi:hypothetical protein